MSKFVEILKKMAEESTECKTKIVATHKVTDAQKKLWLEYSSLMDKAKELKTKADTAKKKFWNKVEGDLNEFDRNIKIDDEKWTLEVHEDDCENCDK